MTRPSKPPAFDVVAVGEANVDLILLGDVEPSFGQVEKLLGDARLCVGGSTAIFACGAGRLGLRTAMIAKVGSDVLGRFMIDSLRERGVDTTGVVVDPEIRTGVSVILNRGVDRAILTYPGTIPALRFAEVDPGIVHAARHLHVGSYFLLDSLRPEIPRLCREARESGMTVSLDTNYDPAGTWGGGMADVLRHLDVFLPNAAEALAITGERTVERAISILAKDVPLVGVKLGARGAMARHGSSPLVAMAAPPVGVVDTVGAGDSFDAGFLFGFLQGWEPRKCLALGVACGSLATRSAGGTDAQPDLTEALRFVREG